MKFAVCALGIALAAAAWGDRLFRIPTGTVLNPGSFRLEFGSPLVGKGRHAEWMQVGLTDRIELAAVHETFPSARSRGSVNVDYGLFPPLTQDLPGIGAGILDLFNETERGRSYYVAFTYATPLINGAAWERDFKMHFGFSVGGIKGAFVGFNLPFTNNFSLQGEHDGQGISAGVQWRPLKELSLRLYMQNDRPTWGLSFSNYLDTDW